MKFTVTFCVAALAALVSAQQTESDTLTSIVATTTVSTVSSTSTYVVPMTPQQSCAAQCNPSDVGCMAACANVPNPDEAQANRTTECAAACPQGSGSEADTAAYARCQQNCISSIYLSTRTDATTLSPVAPAGVTGVATTTTTGTAVTTTGSVLTLSRSTTVASSTATSTASGSTSTSTTTSFSSTTVAASQASGAAVHLEMGAPAAGIAGLVVAMLAL